MSVNNDGPSGTSNGMNNGNGKRHNNGPRRYYGGGNRVDNQQWKRPNNYEWRNFYNGNNTNNIPNNTVPETEDTNNTRGRYNKFENQENKQHYRGNNTNNVERRDQQNYKIYSKNIDQNKFESVKDERPRRKENITKIIKVDTSKMDQRELLIHHLSINSYECMICINSIRKEAAIWSCGKCFNIFHFHCINKWSQSGAKKENSTNNDLTWRCPACQNENESTSTTKLFYTCFCNKQTNPTLRNGTTPHSCGDVCSQRSQTNQRCPHLCSSLCHPGPCPPCEASITRLCHCGRTHITARCSSDDAQFHCQSICERTLSCGNHKCTKECHTEDGHQCAVMLEQCCWCGCSSRRVLCGSPEAMVDKYECGEICGRQKRCGNHFCESLCHEGDCDDCDIMPEKVASCCCGKVILKEIADQRKTCVDPIPVCGGICGKKYSECGHACSSLCHPGKCSPCAQTTKSPCLCKRSVQTVLCDSTNVIQCKQRCGKKLSCRRHRCEKQCCNSVLHVCIVNCGRMLSCKQHQCQRECGHGGLCPPCLDVSFDELFCECGSNFISPPVACGQKPPPCNQPCPREHSCGHQVRHNCHSEPNCPLCTELVVKPCPGGHAEYPNTPCFRPVTTCGRPCGKPLANCDHVCIRTCHGGECLQLEEECTQPCSAPRKKCNHACAAPCHTGECDSVMDACLQPVKLTCECKLRASSVTCDRFEKIRFILTTEKQNASADVILSTTNNQAYLTCDTNCKKAARNAQFADAFGLKVQLGFTFYPEYVKDYASKNKSYLITVQNVLVKLQNGFVNSQKNCLTETIHNVNHQQMQFIQRYVDIFKMKIKFTTDKNFDNKAIIEATRGVSKMPQPLLTEVMKEKYPNLF